MRYKARLAPLVFQVVCSPTKFAPPTLSFDRITHPARLWLAAGPHLPNWARIKTRLLGGRCPSSQWTQSSAKLGIYLQMGLPPSAIPVFDESSANNTKRTHCCRAPFALGNFNCECEVWRKRDLNFEPTILYYFKDLYTHLWGLVVCSKRRIQTIQLASFYYSIIVSTFTWRQLFFTEDVVL